MRGWLVVNHQLNTEKFNETALWLEKAALSHGIDLQKHTNAELICRLGGEPLHAFESTLEKPDLVLFWDKDIRLAALLEECGLSVFNSSSAIEACDDKALMYIRLLRAGIKMPKTIISPKLFFEGDSPFAALIEQAGDELGYPLVVKECCGSFGEQVYLVHTPVELAERVRACGTKPLVFQEFIKSSFGRDIRINVVGGEPVACMYRYSENGDFRANITNGGSMKAYSATPEQKSMAVSACRTLGLAFAGVDILFGRDEEPILCEVNSNAHFINIYKCTGINVADSIMKYISEAARR